jgi:hypothetical protein
MSRTHPAGRARGRPRALAALLAALVLSSGVSAAEPASDVSACLGARDSLSSLARSLAQKLLPAASGASVTIVELKSDRELPAPDALRERVQNAVLAALRPAGESGGERSKLRVELSVEKSGGVLRVTADLRRATGLWQRVRHKKPAAEQHAFVEVPLDAELRALIPPPPLVVSETLKLKAPERGIVAIACGPLGADGAQELALVSRSSIRVGRIAGRSFAERKRVPWSALSPVAPAPLREPIALAEIAHGTLRVGLTDRRDGLVLSRELAVTERFEALLPSPGETCVERSELGLGRQLPCTASAIPARRSPGTLLAATPGLIPNDVRVGAQLAVGDADSDGSPELAFSADTLEPNKDRLTLVTLAGGKLLRRFEVQAPNISAIAICVRDRAGMAPIALATGDELWLLR